MYQAGFQSDSLAQHIWFVLAAWQNHKVVAAVLPENQLLMFLSYGTVVPKKIKTNRQTPYGIKLHSYLRIMHQQYFFLLYHFKADVWSAIVCLWSLLANGSQWIIWAVSLLNSNHMSMYYEENNGHSGRWLMKWSILVSIPKKYSWITSSEYLGVWISSAPRVCPQSSLWILVVHHYLPPHPAVSRIRALSTGVFASHFPLGYAFSLVCVLYITTPSLIWKSKSESLI